MSSARLIFDEASAFGADGLPLGAPLPLGALPLPLEAPLGPLDEPLAPLDETGV